MINNLKYSNIFLASAFAILSLVISRIIPHPINFTPIIASAIFVPYIFRSKYIAIFILLMAMLISDLLIGFHKLMVFVYFPLVLSILLSDYFKLKLNYYLNLTFLGLFGSILFFLISNFGVWLVLDLYPKNIGGLITCYIMAIPFFKNTIISTMIFLIAFTLIYRAIRGSLEYYLNFNLYWFKKI